MNLSEKTKSTILALQSKYPNKRSALIPALHIAQREIGYLPTHIQKEIADLFEIDQNEVNALVSFYDMFHEKPTGKHILHVCKNISCMLRGSDDIISALCKILKVKPGNATEDGEFTIIESECLAACDKGPMMLADDKVFGNLKENDLDNLLNEIKKQPHHPAPIGDIDNG